MSDDTVKARGKKKREPSNGPVWLEFRYSQDGRPLGYFWGPGFDEEKMRGQPATFGVVQ